MAVSIPKPTAESSLYRGTIYYRSGGFWSAGISATIPSVGACSLDYTETSDSLIVPAYRPRPETVQQCLGALYDVHCYLPTGPAGIHYCYKGTFADCLGKCERDPSGNWFYSGTAGGFADAQECKSRLCDEELFTPSCCPTRCGPNTPLDPPSGCCDVGETCAAPNDPHSREGCCPRGQNVCGGKCCPPGVTCCGNSCGCPADKTCIQGVCCYRSEPGVPMTLCNGQCCSGSCDQNGQCCGGFGRGLCGGICIDTQTFGCVNGIPCPNERACVNRTVCCPSGQSCINGTCTGGCPPGTAPVSCQYADPTHPTGPATMCCPPGVPCCNGQCCPFASDQRDYVTCCYPEITDVPPFNNTNFGCHHGFACFRIP